MSYKPLMASCFNSVSHKLKLFKLLPSISFVFFIGCCKVSKNSCYFNIRKFKNFVYFIKIFLSWSKTYSVHTCINLYMDKCCHIKSLSSFRNLFCNIIIKNSLSKSVFNHSFHFCFNCISQNKYRNLNTAFSKGYTLITSSNSQLICTIIKANPADLQSTMTIRISLYNS